jgi:DNA-binding transcriptional LysR family regulator
MAIMEEQDINLRHFLALADIADAGRLSVAAERLFMSQSALTQALRKLEDKAGAPIFERSGFGVTATQAGVLMVRRSQRAGEYLQRAEREIRSRQRSISGPVRLAQNVTSSQLRALIRVVDSGGYSTAARDLGLAQPTVHRAAKELESTIGAPLFRRAARGVEPSDAARVFARYAELVFGEIRQALEEVLELQGSMRSRVAVGCLPLARSEFLPTAITQLLSTYPEARVSILDGPYVEQLHALRCGQIDWLVGALREPAPASDVVEEPLFEQTLAVVVRPGHPLIRAGRVPEVGELARLEWIAPQPLSPARHLFTAFFEREGLEPPTRIIECGSLIATCGLVQQSDRAALLSPLQIRQYVETRQLAVLIESLPGTRRSIGITLRHDYVPTRVQAAFGRIVRDLASRQSPS